MKKNKFDLLRYDEYYVARKFPENGSFEEAYWGLVEDPDGMMRNIGNERVHKRILAKREIEFINSLPAGAILDFGCGTGAIIEGVSDHWDKYGVEVSEYAAKEAQKYCKVFYGQLEEAGYSDYQFDVILMFHVVEHLHQPLEIIRIMRRLLKDNGWLIVSTPDFDSGCARRYGENYRLLHDLTHISMFSSESMQRLLQYNGFNVEHTEYEYFDTEYFTEDNLLRLMNAETISPPFYGNIMTKYCTKMTRENAFEWCDYIKKSLINTYYPSGKLE